MADNRTRKQDRKQIKLIQKSIRRMEDEAAMEQASHPDGIASHRYQDLVGEISILRAKVARLSQALDTPEDWDERDNESYARIRLEQARKDRRERKQEQWDGRAA